MELSDKLELKFRLNTNQKKALHKLKIFSVADLLFHFPVRYSDISTVIKIANLIPGDSATIYGKISNLKTKKGFHTKIPMAEGEIEDMSGKIKIIWFHQAYLAKILHDGENVKLTGKVTEGKQGTYLANPEFEKIFFTDDISQSLTNDVTRNFSTFLTEVFESTLYGCKSLESEESIGAWFLFVFPLDETADAF